MIQEILIPSEVNEFNITGKSNEPLNNACDAFGFVYRDDCGNFEDIDISNYEFTFTISLSGCTVLTGGTNTAELVKCVGLDSNKLWFNIDSLDLRPSIYQYNIKIVDSNSVIKGTLNVK
jgi:hypothetical protein